MSAERGAVLVNVCRAGCVDMGMGRGEAASTAVPNFALGVQYMLSK